MGSKLRNPNHLHEWGNESNVYSSRQCYIAVIREVDSEMVHLVESPVLTDGNKNKIFKILQDKGSILLDKYGYPEYDIHWMFVSGGLRRIKSMYLPEDDFAGLEIDRIEV